MSIEDIENMNDINNIEDAIIEHLLINVSLTSSARKKTFLPK